MSEEFPLKGEGGETTKKRTTRPAVQLYRPGMMKTGTDITKNVSRHTHKAKPPKLDVPVENDSQSKQGVFHFCLFCFSFSWLLIRS